MSLSIEEVEKISKLARLKFDDQEKQKLQGELSQILDYVDQVKTLAESLPGGINEDPAAINLMRDDVAEPVADPANYLKQAQALEGNMVKVKSVLE